jgi:hypothetical protein
MNDYLSVIERVNNVFIFTDSHNWEILQNEVFAKDVLLDYTSFTGGEPATLPSEQIVDSWKGFLPLFKSTHHQVGNYQVNINGSRASVFCYGTASHYLPNPSSNNLWWVVGSYDFDVEKMSSGWRITKMKFNFKYQNGNLELPKLAMAALHDNK